MVITEKQRHELFTRAEEVLGADEAATMMELIGPMAWSDLAKDADLRAVNGDVVALQQDMTVLKVDVAGLKVDVAGLRVDVAGLKTDLATFRVDVERQFSLMTRTFVTWLLASQTTLVGLVALIVTIGQ